MIRKLIATVALLFIGITATAQVGTASPYSFYGIGSIKFNGTMENRAMGGVSLFPDSLALNLLNPAALGKLNLTNYSLGASFSRFGLKSDSGDATAKSASFDYLALGFPISRKLGASFGLLPYSAVGYALQNIDSTGQVAETYRYSGEGGLNKVFVSFGYEITKNLSIGVTGNYDFGRIDNTAYSIRENVELSTREQSYSSLSGLDFKLALNYQKSLKNGYTIYSSAMYVPEAKISSENLRNYSTVLLYTNGQEAVRETYDADLESEGLAKTDVTLPQRTTFGLGLGHNNHWFVGAEYEYAQLSGLSNPFLQINGVAYQDAGSFSVGGMWVPDYDSFTSYFKRTTYRAGFKYENTGMIINNQQINDFGISFGIGLPVGRLSKLNLGFDFGKRGTTEGSLIRENYFNFRVGLSLLDRWFIKNKIN